MKKVLLVVMSIIMALNLCACGGKKTSGNGGFLSSEPTEQEKEVIDTYAKMLNALDGYVEDGSIGIYDVEIQEDVWGAQALEYCYKTIQELEDVDKWIGTEYLSDTRTRQEVLDAFTIVKGVKLQESTVELDHFGEAVRDAEITTYSYNEKGIVVEEDMERNYVGNFSSLLGVKNHYFIYGILGKFNDYGSDITYNYDDAGQVIEYMVDQKLRITPNYDDSGRITSLVLVDREEGPVTTLSSVYDNQNRLIKMEGAYGRGEEYDQSVVFTYSYDDKGNLVKEVQSDISINLRYGRVFEEKYEIEYVYDKEGNVISGVCNYLTTSATHNSTTSFSTVYNDEGRLLTINSEYDSHDTLNEQHDTKYRTDITYGDLYLYNPNK